MIATPWTVKLSDMPPKTGPVAASDPTPCWAPIQRHITGGVGLFPAPAHFSAGRVWAGLGWTGSFPLSRAQDSRLGAPPYSFSAQLSPARRNGQANLSVIGTKHLSNNRQRKKCYYDDLFKGTLAHTKCCSQYAQFLNLLTACLQNGHVVRRSDTTTDLSSYRSPCSGNSLGSCLATTSSLVVSFPREAEFLSDIVIVVEVFS